MIPRRNSSYKSWRASHSLCATTHSSTSETLRARAAQVMTRRTNQETSNPRPSLQINSKTITRKESRRSILITRAIKWLRKGTRTSSVMMLRSSKTSKSWTCSLTPSIIKSSASVRVPATRSSYWFVSTKGVAPDLQKSVVWLTTCWCMTTCVPLSASFATRASDSSAIWGVTGPCAQNI